MLKQLNASPNIRDSELQNRVAKYRKYSKKMQNIHHELHANFKQVWYHNLVPSAERV
jgi:hypothetical protein